MRIKSAEMMLLPSLELEGTHNHLAVDLLEVINGRRVLDLTVNG